MKPKINLESPINKLALEIFKNQVEEALKIEQKIEKSVIPIYVIPKVKEHKIKKRKPEQIGSGVLVKIQEEFFVFSATHVFEEYEGYAILLGAGDGTLIKPYEGERYSSKKVVSTENNSIKSELFDASVYHIQSELEENLKILAITLEDMDFEGYDQSKPIFIMSGFRVKKSNTKGVSVNSKREGFTSIEYNLEDYKKRIYNSLSHILLAYENQILVNNKWKISPIPRGFSGGAIIKIKGTSTKYGLNPNIQTRQLLSGIIIEHHRDKNGELGMLVGTRVKVHLGLIQQFMPEILYDFLKSWEQKEN
ncbi:hypothetical protein [Eudoraea adriatica]|uniref:hypothetical protein n=1 Tax=Eudoraea adriatica TaxID=446681 RepID=UPI0003660488|nr:hypothetical protein [Eudoraea adriatica]